MLAIPIGYAPSTATPPTRAATADKAPSPPNTPLQVSVTKMAPVVLSSRSRTVLAGTVSNATAVAATDVSVRVALSTSRYGSTSSLGEALDPERGIATAGLRVNEYQLPQPIGPGATSTWKLRLPAHVLDGWGNGVYVLDVSARSGADYSIQGASRIALPWFDSPNAPAITDRMNLAWLWPLTTVPNRDVAGVLLNDQTPAEIRPGGRLAGLVQAGTAHASKITWVVDPALLQTVEAMSHGYSVLDAEGNPGPTQPGSDATGWLSAARAAVSAPAAEVFSTTYADADVTSLASGKLVGDVVLANTMAPELTSQLLGHQAASVIAWPADGVTTSGALAALHGAGVRVLNLGPGAFADLPTSSSTAMLNTKTGPLQALVGDPTLGRTLSGPPVGGDTSRVAQRQLFLAQTAIQSQSEARRSVVVAPDLLWATDPVLLDEILSGLDTAQWARTAPVGALLERANRASPQTLAPLTKAQDRRQLSSTYLHAIRTQQARLSLLSAITTEPSGLTAGFASSLIRTESAAWRTRHGEGARLLERLSERLSATEAKVRPVSGGVVTFSTSAGNVPITVANDLTVPVRVGVKLIGDPGIRLVQGEPVVLDVPAKHKVSAEVPAQVLGAGSLPVNVQLTTPAGANYGRPARVTLRTTAYAKAATYVVAGAFVVLVLAITVSSVRRRRRLAGARDAEGHDDV